MRSLGVEGEDDDGKAHGTGSNLRRDGMVAEAGGEV